MPYENAFITTPSFLPRVLAKLQPHPNAPAWKSYIRGGSGDFTRAIAVSPLHMMREPREMRPQRFKRCATLRAAACSYLRRKNVRNLLNATAERTPSINTVPTSIPALLKRLLLPACAICAAGSLTACAPNTRETAPPVTMPAAIPPHTSAPPEKPTLPKPKPPAPKSQPDDTPGPTFEPLPASFVGLSKSDIAAMFGRAQEESERQPAEIWIYRLEPCVAEFVFLLDVTRNDRFVADWKVTGDASASGQERCLQRMRVRHGK
jgi:hypothetical protein